MTKTNTRSRIVSILLVLAMLLTMVPINVVTASAAASGNGTKGNPYVVTTYEDWKEKMELTGDKYIKLGADIDTSKMNGGYGLGSTDFVSAIGRSYLDLNGKKLTLKKSIIESGGAIHFIRLTAGELIIEDSKGSGEIVGVNNVTKRYMQLIDVTKDTKLTLNSGKLHLEGNPDSDTPNATIRFNGTVEINGGTVSVSKWGEWDEPAAYIIRQNFALQAADTTSSCCALITGGTFDGRVLLGVVAKASGVADNVITGGDFKKSIYIRKDEKQTGDVPLNVSIQGGTYHYTPGYMTDTSGENAGKRSSNPLHLFQFATMGFKDEVIYHDGTVYPVFPGESSNLNYDMNAFASMFHKNAIISATGQEYEFIDSRFSAVPVKCEDAVYTGSSSALDLAHLVNSHYKTVTVTTLPEDALKDMKLTVGDGTPLPAKGNSTVSGDVTLGSDGTLTKNVYISAIGNKQLKEMYYSNPSKIDFGYRLNIFKDGKRVDYTGVISQTYAVVGDEISVSVQLPNFKFEEGVYTFRLGLHSDLRGSEAQVGKTLVGLWKLTAKEAADLPIDSVALNVPELKVGDTPGDFTLSGTNTGVSAVTTEWKDIPATGVVESTDYSAFVRLKAENGYVFDANTNVTLIGDYWGSNTGISSDGKTMTVLVGVRILHKHTFGEWKDLGNSEYHVRNCSCLAQEKEPHTWKYDESLDKYKCTKCGHTIDGEKERITYVYASPRSPIDGEHPGDYTPAEWVKIGGANYTVESIVWKNMDDTDVTTFESGKIYTGTVTFKADEGFAFDGDRIYASKIFDSSNAEVVGNYTLADGGTTLTATFKLKDANVVKPGLQVKVKLPTLNDKIGQSLPAVELVDTTLPENVTFTYNVYENDISTEVTDPDYKVKPNQKYFYLVWLKLGDSTDITEITKTYNVSYEVTDGGDTETCTDLVGYGVLAMYQTPDTSKINSVALTVTAPKYGEAPATTATGANDTRYTVGTPTWTPAVTDGKFGANTYTVSIPVTAAEGNSFDANCIYTVNGYVATYADNKVSYTFPALTAPHEHSYGTWTMLDDSQHSRSCICGDMQFEAHTFSAWTKVDESTHSRTCSKCKKSGEATNYTETAEHTWVWVVDQEGALDQPGKQHEECTGCHAKRSENTEIPALRDYAVTVTGGTATVAAGTPITRAMEGVEVTVTAQAPDGKHFVKWVVKAGGVTLANETSATTTFIMPANDVTIEAEIAENPVESYTLTVIKGTASVAAGTPITDKIEQNTVVTVTADAPETGKVFDKWVVLEGNVTLADATKATTTFTMPGNDVKIEATYKDAPPSDTHSYGVYVGMTYTAGNFIYQITSIDTATLGQSKVIGVVAAEKNKITEATIPDRADCKGYGLNVTAIGNNAFAGCKALEKLTIGNKVTVIGKNAFKKCSKLKTVVIGKAVTTISSKAFIGDNKIKKITFKGDKLKTVKKNAFSKKAKKNIKSKKTKLKGNKKAIKLFKKKLKIK